ncbi:MAG: hypothetical protein Q4D54_08110 [Eubacteriales bacterium]|nr:hypothetical protein [Lachnospiraceae bacterium]MDO5127698.1 hypothetical protein [Eubacteriales bacterium]
MLHKKQKGEYGYMSYCRRLKLLITLMLACMIAFVIVGTLIMFEDTNRVIIVFAILLALPFAKYLATWIACAKFKPFTTAQYKEFQSKLEDVDATERFLLYDVTVSKYEGMLFFQSIFVKNGKIIALAFESKGGTMNNRKYKSWIESCIEAAKEPYPVTVYDNIDAFIKKIESIKEPSEQTFRMDQYIAKCILDTCV